MNNQSLRQVTLVFAAFSWISGLSGCHATKEMLAKMKEGPKNTACDLGMEKLGNSIQTDSTVIGSRVANTIDVLKLATDEIETCKADIAHNDKPRLKLNLAITLRGYAILNRGHEDPAKRLAEARTYIQQAADQDYAPAQLLLGSIIENEDQGDENTRRKEWLKWYRLAGNQGQVGAQVKMGEYFMSLAQGPGLFAPPSNGQTPAQNADDAIKWFRLAAEQGDTDAMVYLGNVYQNRSSFDDASRWFRKAVDKQNPAGEAALATLYEKGKGVPKSNQEAFRLLMRETMDEPRGIDGQGNGLYAFLSNHREFMEPLDLMGRGHQESLRGDNDRAIADVTKAIQAVPDVSYFYVVRAGAYFRKKAFAEAKQDCEYALKLTPDAPSAVYCRGKVKSALGDSAGGTTDMTAAEAAHESVQQAF